MLNIQPKKQALNPIKNRPIFLKSDNIEKLSEISSKSNTSNSDCLRQLITNYKASNLNEYPYEFSPIGEKKTFYLTTEYIELLNELKMQSGLTVTTMINIMIEIAYAELKEQGAI